VDDLVFFGDILGQFLSSGWHWGGIGEFLRADLEWMLIDVWQF